jgi:epoxyqueuosine reductase
VSDRAAIVREAAADLGFDVVGITSIEPLPRDDAAIREWLAAGRHGDMAYLFDKLDMRARPNALLPEARSVVTVAVEHATQAPSFEADGRFGRVARYAWGRDYHVVVGERLETLAREVETRLGHGVKARALVDGAPLLERALAVRAGVGFVGKNTMVIRPGRGSWFLLGELLLDVELAPTEEATGLSCGSCRQCLNLCPTDAFPAPFVLDANKCLSYLTIEHRGAIPVTLRSKMGAWAFGCDVCQEVCPFNRFASASKWPELEPAAGVGPRLDLVETLSIESDDAFRARFRGTALLRPKRRGLLRNAAVVARNVGATAAVPALRDRALYDREPLIRGHALWALAGLDPAVARPIAEWALTMDPDAFVRDEATAALA